MKRFISTRLFFSLQEASRGGIDKDAEVLEEEYDEFSELVFSGDAPASDKTAYHNALAHTRVELLGLTGVSEKKCGHLSEQSHRTA
jgi:hypothetical protein